MTERKQIRVSATFQRLSSSLGLLLSRLTQVRVEPAAEAVLLVPAALPMADQHQLVGGHPHTDALCAIFPECAKRVALQTRQQQQQQRLF